MVICDYRTIEELNSCWYCGLANPHGGFIVAIATMNNFSRTLEELNSDRFCGLYNGFLDHIETSGYKTGNVTEQVLQFEKKPVCRFRVAQKPS